MRARSVAVLLVVVAITNRAHAQGRDSLDQPASVPFELAAALAATGGFSNGSPQILVGAIPEWARDRLPLPAHATVLGSAYRGNDVTVAISLPLPADSAVGELVRHFTAQGWTLPPGSRRESSGGFRPALREVVSPPRQALLCGAQLNLYIAPTRREPARSTVTVRMNSAPRMGVCTTPPVVDDDRPSLPTLYDPEAVTPSYAGCEDRRRGAGSGTSTRFRTAMSADAILDHYGRQLADSGWTAMPGAKRTVTRTWSRPDSAGRQRILELMVEIPAVDASCRQVILMIYRG